MEEGGVDPAMDRDGLEGDDDVEGGEEDVDESELGRSGEGGVLHVSRYPGVRDSDFGRVSEFAEWVVGSDVTCVWGRVVGEGQPLDRRRVVDWRVHGA